MSHLSMEPQQGTCKLDKPQMLNRRANPHRLLMKTLFLITLACGTRVSELAAFTRIATIILLDAKSNISGWFSFPIEEPHHRPHTTKHRHKIPFSTPTILITTFSQLTHCTTRWHDFVFKIKNHDLILILNHLKFQ